MKQSLCWVLVLASCGCGERRQASVQRTESRLWKTNMLTQTHDVPQKLRAVSCSHNTNIQKQEVKIQVDSLRHVRFLFLLPRKKKYVCAAVSVCIQLRLFRRVFLLNNVFFMTLQLIIMLIKANQTTMVSWQRMYFGPTGYCLVTFFLFFLNSVYFFEQIKINFINYLLNILIVFFTLPLINNNYGRKGKRSHCDQCSVCPSQHHTQYFLPEGIMGVLGTTIAAVNLSDKKVLFMLCFVTFTDSLPSFLPHSLTISWSFPGSFKNRRPGEAHREHEWNKGFLRFERCWNIWETVSHSAK